MRCYLCASRSTCTAAAFVWLTRSNWKVPWTDWPPRRRRDPTSQNLTRSWAVWVGACGGLPWWHGTGHLGDNHVWCHTCGITARLCVCVSHQSLNLGHVARGSELMSSALWACQLLKSTNYNMCGSRGPATPITDIPVEKKPQLAGGVKSTLICLLIVSDKYCVVIYTASINNTPPITHNLMPHSNCCHMLEP